MFMVIVLLFIIAPVVLCSCFGQLYSGDFIRRGLEFDNGKYSYEYKDGLIIMGEMDLAFGIQPENLTVGVQGQNKAAFVNLGREVELALKYNINPVADGNVYSSLIYNSNNNTFSILKDQTTYTFQPLLVFLQNVLPMQSFIPIPSNIYLINSTYNNVDKSEQFKLIRLYIASASNNIVSIRWDLLFDSSEDLNNINCGRQAVNDNNVLTESAIYDYTPQTANVPAWLYSIAVAAIAVAVVSFIGLIILTIARPSPNYQRIQ